MKTLSKRSTLSSRSVYPSYNDDEWQGEDDDIDDDIERETED